uniref:Uncharacterized protein n=1 Tax=Triticum urartu TaxID=4572 RepID=A0A8R7UB98_TRIUA
MATYLSWQQKNCHVYKVNTKNMKHNSPWQMHVKILPCCSHYTCHALYKKKVPLYVSVYKTLA